MFIMGPVFIPLIHWIFTIILLSTVSISILQQQKQVQRVSIKSPLQAFFLLSRTIDSPLGAADWQKVWFPPALTQRVLLMVQSFMEIFSSPTSNLGKGVKRFGTQKGPYVVL